jgi:hypothetical protein
MSSNPKRTDPSRKRAADPGTSGKSRPQASEAQPTPRDKPTRNQSLPQAASGLLEVPKKKAHQMTSDELAHRVFPHTVVEELRRIARESDSKSSSRTE